MSKRLLLVIAALVVVIAGGSVLMFKRTMQKGVADREGRILQPAPPPPAR